MMFKTMLFDLDGTLLNINMDTFLPGYFKILTERFVRQIKPEEFIKHLYHCTHAMIENLCRNLSRASVYLQKNYNQF